jgi:predicted nucleic acid-binding protein
MPARLSRAGTPTDVAKKFLLDTGFVVALLNADDPDHERCVDVWRDLRARLYSVEGVLVEAAHLLRRTRSGASSIVGLVYGAGTELLAMSEDRAQRAAVLMDRYHDVPMDFVDALLVVVAEEQKIRDVLTLDRRGFETYRVGRERFRILP